MLGDTLKVSSFLYSSGVAGLPLAQTAGNLMIHGPGTNGGFFLALGRGEETRSAPACPEEKAEKSRGLSGGIIHSTFVFAGAFIGAPQKIGRNCHGNKVKQ